MTNWATRRSVDEESPHLDRFGSLLGLTIVCVATLSLVDVDTIEDSAVRGVVAIFWSTTTCLTLVLALRAAGVARRHRRIAEVSLLLATVGNIVIVLANVLADIETPMGDGDRPSLLWVLIAVLAPPAVIRRLWMHRRVTGETMAGAVAAYLLIAVAFCYGFLYLDSLVDGGVFAGDAAVPSHEFMYFSLVSITTLGYGDLAPGGSVAQLMATTEAVIGQVYLVTFVGMLVGLVIQQRDSALPTPAAGSEDARNHEHAEDGEQHARRDA